MSDIKRFLELVNQEIYFGNVSEEFEILFETLSRKYSCNDFTPEKIKEKNQKEYQEKISKKDFRCKICFKEFTPEGLFYHFKNCHEKEYIEKFGERNVNHTERIKFGIEFGEEANKIHQEKEERKHYENLFLEMLTGYCDNPSSYNWKSWNQIVKLCKEKKVNLHRMFVKDFSNEEISELYNQYCEDVDFFNEQNERREFIDKIISHFNSNDIFSKNVLDTDVAKVYRKIFFNHFDTLENPSLTILGKFSTNELKEICFAMSRKSEVKGFPRRMGKII